MKDFAAPPQMPLRPPSDVMRLARMGAMFPTRLSFLRVLMRRLASEEVVVERPVWNMCENGFGHAVYSLKLGGYTYSLVAVSTDLPPEKRTDRVIAEAWDSAYVLYDGVPGAAEIARICASAPKQEAGRFTQRDLVLSRANKSVRLFAHVVEALRAGTQPNADMIRDIGYLMRTTAVYGNGKFGIADRGLIENRPALEGPFAAEMLTVWMIRNFTHDLVEHVGQGTLERRFKRHLGIGNSTGLGMAPFLVNHPVLLNNWMIARETGLARVRAIPAFDADEVARITALAKRAAQHLEEWSVPDPEHQARVTRLRADWADFTHDIHADMALPNPADVIHRRAQTMSLDIQELAAAMVLEPFGALIDGLAECMGDPFGALPVYPKDTSGLWADIDACFAWALTPDYTCTDESRQFWYVSEAKQEPRLGDRYAEDGAHLESPLDIGRRIKALHSDLPKTTRPLAEFLMAHPEHGLAIERVALAKRYPYAEIHDNLIARTCLPIDMLRCKLSFFGASKFDPKSDRWTRITLCQGAPLRDELGQGGDDWWLPVFGA